MLLIKKYTKLIGSSSLASLSIVYLSINLTFASCIVKDGFDA